MRSVLVVVVGVLLGCAKQAASEVSQPEPAAAEADAPATEAEATAAEADEPPTGHVGCDVEGKATWVSCTSPGEREDCCKKAGGTPNSNWCPPDCSLVGNDCKC